MAHPDLEELRRVARQGGGKSPDEVLASTRPIVTPQNQPRVSPQPQVREPRYIPPQPVTPVYEYDSQGVLFWMWWLFGITVAPVSGMVMLDEWLWQLGLVLLAVNVVFALFTNGYTKGSATEAGVIISFFSGAVACLGIVSAMVEVW